MQSWRVSGIRFVSYRRDPTWNTGRMESSSLSSSDGLPNVMTGSVTRSLPPIHPSVISPRVIWDCRITEIRSGSVTYRCAGYNGFDRYTTMNDSRRLTHESNNKAKKQNYYDSNFIGTSISGGWGGKELSERSLEYSVLE